MAAERGERTLFREIVNSFLTNEANVTEKRCSPDATPTFGGRGFAEAPSLLVERCWAELGDLVPLRLQRKARRRLT